MTLAGGEVADTAWHHISLCKVGSDYGIYLDGTQTAFVTDADTDTFTGVLRVGALSASNYFDGYIGEAKISSDNYFSATPVVGLSDTISVPTAPYMSGTGYTLVCDSVSLALAGQDATLTAQRVLVCDTASLTLAGQDASLVHGYNLVCESSALTLEGQDLTRFVRHIKVNEPVMAITGIRN